jgi:CheY-like chemotaxis protein
VKVLVIDDDHSIRKSLLRVLRGYGLDAAGARNQSEALKLAATLHPDAIVLDLLMDDGDGLHIAEALKSSPELRCVPIIVLTASPDLASGAQPLFKTVLTKPCRSAELLRALTESIKSPQSDPDPTCPHRIA